MECTNPKKQKMKIKKKKISPLAGIEPGSSDSESNALPLFHAGILENSAKKQRFEITSTIVKILKRDLYIPGIS